MPLELLRRQGLSFYAAHQQAGTDENEEFNIREWPTFSFDACPGILGDFVSLATRDSEADPAAVCITSLVRFCAEVYCYAPKKAHIFLWEKRYIRPDFLSLFAAIPVRPERAHHGIQWQNCLAGGCAGRRNCASGGCRFQRGKAEAHYPLEKGWRFMPAICRKRKLNACKNKTPMKFFPTRGTSD